MLPTWDTERLHLRPWRPDDAEDAFLIYGDAEVYRFLGDGKPRASLDEMRASLEGTIARDLALPDYGSNAIVERESGRVVGAVLLKPLPPEHVDIEIGWHLARRVWGRGYASEAARRVLAYALDTLRLQTVWAVVVDGNDRSVAVTRRIGLLPCGPTDRYYGRTLLSFRLDAPAARPYS